MFERNYYGILKNTVYALVLLISPMVYYNAENKMKPSFLYYSIWQFLLKKGIIFTF